MRTVSTPSTKPITSDPLSPMKMRRRREVEAEEAEQRPEQQRERRGDEPLADRAAAVTRNAVVQTAATPALRPSMLSRKLKALVMAAIQRTVRTTDGRRRPARELSSAVERRRRR